MKERLIKYINHYEERYNKALSEGREEDAKLLLQTFYFYVDQLAELR